MQRTRFDFDVITGPANTRDNNPRPEPMALPKQEATTTQPKSSAEPEK
jgi:hypothetical protein